MSAEKERIALAKEPLALDLGCSPAAFDRVENTVVPFAPRPGAQERPECDPELCVACFGKGAAAAVHPSRLFSYRPLFAGIEGSRLFDFPAMARLDGALAKASRGGLPGFFCRVSHPGGNCASLPDAWGNRRASQNPPFSPRVCPGMCGAYPGWVRERGGGSNRGDDGQRPALADWSGHACAKQGKWAGALPGHEPEEVLARGNVPCYSTWTGNLFSKRLAFRRAIFPHSWRWPL